MGGVGNYLPNSSVKFAGRKFIKTVLFRAGFSEGVSFRVLVDSSEFGCSRALGAAVCLGAQSLTHLVFKTWLDSAPVTRFFFFFLRWMLRTLYTFRVFTAQHTSLPSL